MSKFNKYDLEDHDGVCGVIKNENGEILMLNHNKFNFWTFPIGKVKSSETIEEGLFTEMNEELNINIEDYKEIMSVEKVYDRSGKDVKVNLHIFEIYKYDGIITNVEIEKHSDMKWFSVEEILKLENVSDAVKWYFKL